MDSKRLDIVVGIALCIFSIVIYVYAEQQYAGKGVNSYGPKFFPQALSMMMLLASVALIIQALRGKALKGLEKINKQGFIRAMITLIIAIGYVFLMNFLGFYLSTIIFLFVVMTYLGQKKLWIRILASLLVATAVYCLFQYFLKIPLPEGIFYKAI